MSLTQTSAPGVEPITLQQAKDHLRVSHNDEDAIIEPLITAARQHVEAYTKRALITQTWAWSMDAFATLLSPPLPPLQSVSSIAYIDAAGDSQTLASSNYRVDSASEPARITEAYDTTWPTTRQVTNAVTVTFIAGYGDAGHDVPQPIIQAMLLLIGHWYENREALAPVNLMPVPMAVDALLSPYRVVYF